MGDGLCRHSPLRPAPGPLGHAEGIRQQTAALAAVTRNVLLQHRVRLERFDTALQSLSPLAILDRGYALVFDSSGKLVKSADAVSVGDEISARLARGEIHAAVVT